MCLPLLLKHTHSIPTCQGRGWGPGSGVGFWFLLSSSTSATQSGPPLFLHLPPLFLLQMERHPEEVPLSMGPDLLTVRKSGVSRTHSLPNDSYMCRDGSTAKGSLGHRGWGLPKAQSGTRAGGRWARLTPGDPVLA